MPTPFANVAAAITAGYKQVTTDLGVLAPVAAERYEVTLEKALVGPVGGKADRIRAFGVGSSQAAAEAKALAALHEQRDFRYGKAAAGGSKSNRGDSYTTDLS